MIIHQLLPPAEDQPLRRPSAFTHPAEFPSSAMTTLFAELASSGPVDHPLWSPLVAAAASARVGREGLWSAQLWPEASAYYDESTAQIPGLEGLSGEVQLTLAPAVQELRWLQWSRSASAALLARRGEIAADSLTAQARLLSCRKEDLAGLEARLQAFLQRWSEALRYPETESLFATSLAWLLEIGAAVEADFHEWRCLFESLQIALTAHLPEETSFGLVRLLRSVAEQIPRFDFLRLLCAHAPAAPDPGGWAAAPLVLLCAAELLAEHGLQPTHSPLASGLLAAQELPQGWTAQSLGAYLPVLMSSLRPLCERSWLDPLERLLERLVEVLRWRESTRAAGGWTALTSAAGATLSEVLEHYRRGSGKAEELALVFQAACESCLLTVDAARARALFRPWFLHRYASGAALAFWSQPKAVLKALGNATAKAEGLPDGLLQQAQGVLETIPGLLEAVEGARRTAAAPSTADPAAWWLAGSLLSLGEKGWKAEVGRIMPLVGVLSVQRWLEHGADWLGPLDASGKLTELWQERAESRRRLVLAGILWHEGAGIAQRAVPLIYDRLPEYAEQSRPESVEKCQRDFTALLRRITWALLSSGDSVEAVSEWWSEFVEAYLVHRHPRLFDQSQEALLECAGDRLATTFLDLLQEHLQAVLPRLGRDSGSRPSSAPPFLPHAYPLATACPVPEPGFPGLGAWLPPAWAAEDAQMWTVTLEKAVRDYLWRGFLNSETTRRWSLWLSAHPGAEVELETALARALPQLPRVRAELADLLHAVLDYVRSYALGEWLRREGAALARLVCANLVPAASPASAWEAPLTTMLEQWSECARELCPFLGALELRRRLVQSVAPALPPDPDAWRQVWLSLARVPALAGEVEQLLETGHVLGRAGAFCASFSAAPDPVFAPDPDEEAHWRGLLSGLAALRLFTALTDAELRQYALLLVESCSISRDPDFLEKLVQVGQALPHGPDESEVALLGQAIALRRKWESQPTADWPEQELIRHEGLRAPLVGSRWGLPQLCKCSAERLEVDAASTMAALPSGLAAPPAAALGLLERRLQMDVLAYRRGQDHAGAFRWFAEALLPHSGNLIPETLEMGLNAFLSAPTSRDGDPLQEEVLDAFWGPALFRLRDLEIGSSAPSFFAPDVRIATTPGPASSPTVLGRLEASRLAPDDGSLTPADVARMLAVLQNEVTTFERDGLCSPRLGRVSRDWSAAPLEMLLRVAIQQVGDLTDEPVLDRVRAIDYLQANLEWVRQMALGRELASCRDELAHALPTTEGRRVIAALSDLLQLAPRPMACLQFLAYQLEVAARTGTPCLPSSAWRELQLAAQEKVSSSAMRELSWWTHRLGQIADTLDDSVRLLRASSSLGLSSPWHRLLSRLLALRHLAELRPNWLGLLRRAVAESSVRLGSFEERGKEARRLSYWMRETFIELDLRAVLGELEILQKSWHLVQGREELWSRQSSLVELLCEKLPELGRLDPAWIGMLMQALLRGEMGEGPASRWRLEPALRSLPHAALSALSPLAGSGRLEAALSNLLGRYAAVGNLLSVGRLLELAERLPDLETAWGSAANEQTADGLPRRLAVEGWMGSREAPEGTFEWYRWEVVPYIEDSPRRLRQHISAVTAAVTKSADFSEMMKRCACEFERHCELRFRETDKTASLWTVFSLPVVGPTMAHKPEKRGWWNKISESFEGIVSAIKPE